MTAKETEALRKLETVVKSMSDKLFGNGTRNGCIDDRLEHVEDDMKDLKEIMPTMVTKDYCSNKHESKWTKNILLIGMAATWISLILFAVDVL